MYTEEEKVWPADHVPEEKQNGDETIPEDESETGILGTNPSPGVWPEVTNGVLLNVLNDVRVDSNNVRYEMEQLNSKVELLTKRINALEFTVTEALRMCQDAFLRVEKAVVACAEGYEKCKKGYEACKEGFEEVHDLVDDFPNRIDCGVATGYI